MKILLTGNPNVGKSVIFSHLTSLAAISSNYAGTTVDVFKGKTALGEANSVLIDVPGAYSLQPGNEAEKIAAKIINEKEYDLIINVLDSTALERNLFFALSVLEKGKPTIFLANKSDMAKNKGITIDYKGLSKELGIEIIPMIATTGEGIGVLNEKLKNSKNIEKDFTPPHKLFGGLEEKWRYIGKIASQFQSIEHKHPDFLEKMEAATANPALAIPLAALAVGLSFFIIRQIGEGLINFIMDPLFNDFYMPTLLKISDKIFTQETIRFLLLGRTPSPMESFGILTTGIYIPLVVVLPYIISFYLILSFLEDIGYLPRLAVVLDRFSHKIGLHGYGTIPLMMGLGCKVPGILSIRMLETSKEKVIAASLLFLLSPCLPQTAMIFSILSAHPFKYTLLVFSYLFAIGLIAGFSLNKIIKSETPELFIEMPPYQLPKAKLLAFKLWIRLKEFLFDAMPMIFLGVLLINLLDMTGALSKISLFFAPFFTKFFSLPGDMASIMVLGFLKKDVSIALLHPFSLSAGQIAVACVFLVSYLPCAASLFVMIKELGYKKTVYVSGFNFVLSILFSAMLAVLII